MRRFLLIILAVALLATPLSAQDNTDLYFGEALFHAYKGDWFKAISRLDSELTLHYGLDEPQLDSLFATLDDAEFSVGDFELAYGLHLRAGRAIKAVIEADVSDVVRNGALYRLARIHYRKGQVVNALHAVERIKGEIPEHLEVDIAELRALIFMATGRNEAAIKILKRLRSDQKSAALSSYNLGIAYFLDDQPLAAWKQLDSAGQRQVQGTEQQALRDRTNLVLADQLLGAGEYVRAGNVFDRVNLEGPWSNRSLLGAGWSDAAQGDFETAIAPWALLSQREPGDASVQEALLALPYAYGKLGVYSRAALHYSRALKLFGEEIDRLSDSLDAIRSGGFLQALEQAAANERGDRLEQLRRLPRSAETVYLVALMASHDFHEGLNNYLDLLHLQRRLLLWQTDLEAMGELVEQRRAYYQPLLPQIDRSFRLLDTRMRLRLEQRERVDHQLKSLLTAPRVEMLMSAGEREAGQRLLQMRRQGDLSPEQRQRIERLEGVLLWQMRRDYDQRQTEAFEHLQALDTEIVTLQQRYRSFIRLRQAARHSYKGFDAQVRRQQHRVFAAEKTVDRLLKRQGHQLEELAAAELVQRRQRLEEYQIKARFAMADSYDRAVTGAQKEQEKAP